MKQFGVKQDTIEATLVVIYTPDKEIHITNPQVAKVAMMGQESYQISGIVSEKNHELDISEEDIQTVMEGASVSSEEAKAALRTHRGDLAAAIIDLNS